MRVVLLGPPGSGKGTQAKLLAERLSLPAVSTGEMLRLAVREGTPLGRKARAIMEAGDLVPDDLMIALIRERLSQADAQKGFVLDGFPRTLEQAEALERVLRGNGTGLSAVVNLSVPETAIVERLQGRSAQEDRADDRPETVRERLRIYRDRTQSLIEYYRKKGLLKDVDGLGEIPRIAERIDRALTRPESTEGAA
jgi:adenylate kinase